MQQRPIRKKELHPFSMHENCRCKSWNRPAMTPVPSEAGRSMTLAAPKMPSNLCGKEKLRVSGTVIRCFFPSATCTRELQVQQALQHAVIGSIQPGRLHMLAACPKLPPPPPESCARLVLLLNVTLRATHAAPTKVGDLKSPTSLHEYGNWDMSSKHSRVSF